MLLFAVVVAPWWYGCAPESARFTLVAVLLGVCCIGAWSCRPPSRLVWPCLGIASIGLFQALAGQSVGPVQSVEASVVAAAMVGALLFWSDRGRDLGSAIRLSVAVVATCLAQGLFGIAQARFQPGLLYGSPPPGGSPYGSFVNHNHFAGLLEMGVFVAAGLARGEFWRRGRITPRLLALTTICIVILMAHLASGSRGGLIALMGGATVFAVVAATATRPSRRGRVPALAATAIAIVIVTGSFIAIPEGTRQRLATVFGGGVDGSGSYRLALAAASLRLFASSPVVGAGTGSFADAVTPFKRDHGGVRSTHAESDFLEHLAEAGLVGMALLGWLVTRVVRQGVEQLRATRDPTRRGLLVGALGALGAMGFHSFFDFNLHIPSNALMAVCLSGLVAAAAPAPYSGHRMPPLAAASLLLLALAAGWRALGAAQLAAVRSEQQVQLRIPGLDAVIRGHPYLAEARRARGLSWRQLSRRNGAVQRIRLAKARRDLEATLSLRPAWGEAWADLGWTRLLEGDRAAGEESLSRAARLDPTHLGIGLARAEYRFVSGHTDAAISELARLQRTNPSWPPEAAVKHARRWTNSPILIARLRH